LLVDTHAHIAGSEFQEDLSEVLDRAAAVGVERIICVGYDLPTTERAVALADTNPRIFASAGLHPNSVAQAPADWRRRLADLASHRRVIAIGETGLDYYRDWTVPALQQEALRWHLNLADELGLPIIIHNRDADSDVTEALLEWVDRRGSSAPPGVLHSFAGDTSTLERCVAKGFAISFSGMVTFPNKSLAHVAAAAQATPDHALLVETDCPYLAPVPVRGRRNEPAYVRHTAARVAALRGVSETEIERITTANVERVFPRVGNLSHA
jgi:TatD DNase family protein